MKSNSEKFAKKIFSKNEISELKSISTLTEKYKIVVYVPHQDVKNITLAMAERGAGVIGNYSVCSFTIKGTGTFKAGKNSSPAVGKKGKLESVEEVRLEMLCEKAKLNDVILNMISHHPYEEPAYEIYNVLAGSKFNSAIEISFKKTIDLKEILRRINNKLDIKSPVMNTINKKIKNVIIDLDNEEKVIDYISGSSQKTLYINKKTIGAINLTLK